MINNFPMISYSDITDYTNIDTNIDPQQIKNGTINIQNLQLPDYLGYDLVDELVNQIQTNTLTVLNTTLMDYLKPALVNMTLYDIFPLFHSRVQNTGVNQQSGENGTGISDSHMKYLRGEYQTRGESYMNKVVEYLCDNNSSYPLYKPKCVQQKNIAGIKRVGIKNKNKIK